MFSFGNMKIADPLSPRVIATNDVVDAPKRGPRKFFAAWPHGVDPNATGEQHVAFFGIFSSFSNGWCTHVNNPCLSFCSVCVNTSYAKSLLNN